MPQPFEIRDVRTLAEFHGVEEIQRDAWGFADKEIVPQSILVALQSAGGLVLGAFLPDGEIGGFAYSFPALRDGEVFHHSHMAAVLRRLRGTGIALALKREQRRRVLALGLEKIVWTYDPIEARNAAFNIRKLGVVAHRYIVDIYGLSSGFIHGGLPTDRVAVTWDLDSRRAKERAESDPPPAAPPPAGASPINRTEVDARGRRGPIGWTWDDLAPEVVVEIPSDIGSLKEEAKGVARRWRMHIREGLRRLFDQGYRIVDFCLSREGERRPFYLLERSTDVGGS